MLLKVSVAMATYNGGDFIYDQLDSLRLQSRRIDEVIVADDGSTDGTIENIQGYINKYNLVNWKIYRNRENKGFSENFLSCAEKCKGDVIFFCDQDDVWKPNKVEKMIGIFESSPGVSALMCRFSYINENGEPISSAINKIKNQKRMNKIEQIDFSKQVRNTDSSGKSLAVRKTILKNYASVIRNNSLTFDIPIGLFSAVRGNYYIMSEVLVLHRIHSKNTSKPKISLSDRIKSREHQIASREFALKNYIACYQEFKEELSKDDKKNLEKIINDLKERIDCLNNKKHSLLFLKTFRLNPMSNKFSNIMDFICSFY
jgi:glycosyltransferase involved in cell wall biosynthesis